MRIKKFVLVIGTLLFCLNSFGAKSGGTFYIKLEADPTTLNPITSSDAYSSEIHGYVFDSLLVRDEDSYDWVPALAEKWNISKDGTVFTFTLREGIRFHDGKPVTSEDVKYSFDVFFEGRFQAPHRQVYLQNIKEVKVIDSRTVQFITKEVYFKNFDVAAGISILPKHIYSVGDPNDPKFNKELIGNGPYQLEEWQKGQKIILKRNPNYYAKNLPYFKNRFNFDRLFFRIVKEEAVGLELLKKGDLDFIGLTPEQYVTKTSTLEWGKKVIAVKTQNDAPGNYSFSFIAWNFKHPIFQDKDVRVAMSHLVNREFMNQKFRYGMSESASGPFGNRSPSSSPRVKPVAFDSKKALSLLQKNGWKLGENGLSKTIDGKETRFEFTLLTPDPNFDRYATVIKEDMAKIGVTMNIKLVEWNSFIKLLDERKFDAVTLAWQVNDLESDPKQIWHSSAIPAPGHNFISYSNPKIDEMIDKLRKSMNKNERKKYYHQIHELIAADQPYSFLFNRKFSLYAHTSRVKKNKDTYKYALGIPTWWLGD